MRQAGNIRERVLKLTIAMSVIILAVFISAAAAKADVLKVGSTYNAISFTYTGDHTLSGTYGGGSFDVAQLNGQDLPFLYCVDLDHFISLNGTYNNALVSNNGFVNGEPVQNASKVAWLLNEYAESVGVNEAHLQAAIWETIYGDNFTVLSAAMLAGDSDYNKYLAALAAANVDPNLIYQFTWITPDSYSNNVQGQVTRVPEPSLVLLLGIGLGCIGFVTKIRRK